MADKNYVAALAWAGAAAIAVAGAITILVGLSTPTTVSSFGWFAYQPLTEATYTTGGSGLVLSRISAAGWIIFVTGLLGLAFLTGRVVGRKSRA